MKTSFVNLRFICLSPGLTVHLPTLTDHSAKTYTVHHITESQSEDGGAEMVLESVDATVAEPIAITEIPTTTTATTTTTTTTSTTTTSTATPTTITTHRAPASERPAPTIVLVLDNSNNNSRPSLHRAGTSKGSVFCHRL